MDKIKIILLTASITLSIFFCILTAEAQSSSQIGDFEKAKEYHNSAAERMQKYGENDAQSLKLFNQAIDEYKKCITVSNKNTGEAYNFLGRIFLSGPNTLRNYTDAAQYLYEALDIYNKEKKSEEYILGCYLEIGLAFYRLEDYGSAYINWEKLSALSDQRYGNVAIFYWLGLGVEENLPKAMELFRNAALKGNDRFWPAFYALEYQIKEYEKGNFNSESMVLFLDHLHSIEKGEPKEIWMSKLIQSADLGWVPAQSDLWVNYRNNKEYSKGMPYLQKAANANYLPAITEMGWVYHSGLGTKVNYKEAQKWYEKAAIAGHPTAQNNLGHLYFNNYIKAERGYSNKDMAYYWFNISAEQGFSHATKNRTLIENYRPPQNNFVNALQVMNSVLGVMNSSMNTYNNINKSNRRTYISPNDRTQQTVQNNTSGGSGFNPCDNRYCFRGKCNYYNESSKSTCNGGKVSCWICSGSGKTGLNSRVCSNCNGAGFKVCSRCNGSGMCLRCKGTGQL